MPTFSQYNPATFLNPTDVFLIFRQGVGTLSIEGALLPGTGEVSSVGLSLPTSVFTVSNSPITSFGTLTATFNNQSHNTFFAGPVSGTGTPTFRNIAVADLPIVNSNIGTYGSSTNVAQVTVNAQGLITSVTNVAISGGGGGLPTSLPGPFASDAAAAASGISIGQWYRNGSVAQIRVS